METMLDIPYRCPRCDGARTFNTLSELKSHMAEEHAYCAQKRQRLRIFDYTPQHNFMGTGRHSPLLQSFLDEGERLEEEVKAAKREEQNNKLRRQKQRASSSPTSKSAPPTSNHVSHSQSQSTQRKPRVNFRYPLHQEPDTYLQHTVNQLNHDVIAQRQEQFRTADALYTTQDVLSGVEAAAEERVSEQKNFIAELSRQLVEKEQQLLELRTELQKVKERDIEKSQAERDWGESPNANYVDRERERIEDDLLKKKTELEKLNRQLASAKQNVIRENLQTLSERRQETASEKNLERVNQDIHSRVANDTHSRNPDVSEESKAQPSATVSRTPSSSVKDQNNTVKDQKHNLPTRNSGTPHKLQQSHQLPPERDHNNESSNDSEGSWTRPSVNVSRNSSSKSNVKDRTNAVKQQKQNQPTRNSGTPHNSQQSHHSPLAQDHNNESSDDSEGSWTRPSVTVSRNSSSVAKDRANAVKQQKQNRLNRNSVNPHNTQQSHQLLPEQHQHSGNSDGFDRSQTQPSVTVSRNSSSNAKDRSNAVKQQKRNQMNQNSGTPHNTQQSLVSLPEQHHHIESSGGLDRPWTQPFVAVSRNPSSNSKDQSNVVKQQKQLTQQNQLTQNSATPQNTQQSYPSLPEQPHHIHNKLRQDNHPQPPIYPDRIPPSTQKLKEERSHLVEQMKDLLCKATTDNEKLKDELMAKENQLQFLNQELERTKTDQTELMEETYDLYREAEKSLEDLKERLKSKEMQLDQANNRLDDIRQEQERLAKEKNTVAKHSDDKDLLYQNMMRDRDEQIESLNGLLMSQQEEREKLKDMTRKLKQEVHEKEKVQHELSQAIADKEKELAKAKDDVETLSTFLQTAAVKESVARCKLEAFVTELIDRADKAERELDHLRRLENSFSGNLASDPSLIGSLPPTTGLENLSSIPGHSAFNQGTGPLHSTPLASQPRRHGVSSQEPWYNDLSMSGLPSGIQAQPSTGLHQPSSAPLLQQAAGPQAPATMLPGVGYVSMPLHNLSYPMEAYPASQQLHAQQITPVQKKTKNVPIHSSHLPGKKGNMHSTSGFPNNAVPQWDDAGEESSMYAELPRVSKGAHRQSGSSRPAPIFTQSSPYDGGDEKFHSYPAAGIPASNGRGAEKNHRFVVNASGKVLQNSAGSKAEHGSPSARRKANSQASGPRLRTGKHAEDVLDGRIFDGNSKQQISEPISPHRTYSIYSVMGKNAPEVRSDDMSDSTYSFQDTPHFNKAIIDRKPRLKGKVRPSGSSLNKYPGNLYRYIDDSSTDGIELSVDENGIMWEPVESFSEISESYRISPYGSETAGDVDTSVLLSSRSPGNKRAPRGGQDTDEDIDSLDDDGVLRPVRDRGKVTDRKALAERKKVNELPLGDRINRVLKSVGEDDSESLELLMKHMHDDDDGRTDAGVRVARQRTPRPEAGSPLERALAVQDRVKSLTYPGAEKKLVTIATSSSDSLPNRRTPSPYRSTVQNPKPAARQQNGPNSARFYPASTSEEVRLAPFEDFSSSSYASLSHIPVSNGTARVASHPNQQNTSASNRIDSTARNHSFNTGQQPQASSSSSNAPDRDMGPVQQLEPKKEARLNASHFTNADVNKREFGHHGESGRSVNSLIPEGKQNVNQHIDPSGRDIRSNSPATKYYQSSNSAGRDYQSSNPSGRDFHGSNPAGREFQNSSNPSGRDIHNNNPAARDYHSSNPAGREFQTSSNPSGKDIYSNNPAARNYQSSDPAGIELQNGSDPSGRDIYSNNPTARDYHSSNSAGRVFQNGSDPSGRDIHSNNPAARDYHSSNSAGREFQTISNPSGRDIHSNPAARDYQSSNSAGREFQTISDLSGRDIHSNPATRDYQSSNPAGREFQNGSDHSGRDIHSNNPAARDYQSSNPVGREFQNGSDPSGRDIHSNNPATRDYQSSNLAGREFQNGSDPSGRDIHSNSPAARDYQSSNPAARELQASSSPAGRDFHNSSNPMEREFQNTTVPSEELIRPSTNSDLQKSNSINRQASLSRQDSVSMDSLDAVTPAQKLRAGMLPSFSESSLQSSETESVPQSSPPPSLPARQGVKTDNDSTDLDFDMESDLEKMAGAGGGDGRRGTLAGKTGLRKTAHRKPKGKSPGGKPKPEDTTGSSASDIEAAQKNKRREEARRRRVALFRVFSYLDARSLCKMALVCKEWHRVSRHPRLWLDVHLKYERISSQFLVTLSTWCTQMTSLTLEGLRAGSRRPSETMDEYNRRTKGCLEAGLEELLKASQDSLKSLSITACGNILTEKCMWLVSGYCRLLQRLTYLSDTHPLTAEVMWALGGGCPSITSLIIPPLFPCHNSEGMTNRCLMLIAQFYPDLREVGVGGRSLDITGLVPLVQSCQRLHSLSVDHIKEMGDDSATALCRAGMRQLQQLELSGTPVTVGALNTFYNSCHHLKQIRVFICINDFYEDVRKKKHKEEYKKLVKSLEALKKQVGLGNVLLLRAAPAE